MNTREWIHVDDHCSALWFLANNGVYGQKYHIGDHNTMTNIELAHMVAKLICTDDSQMSWSAAVEYVADRPSHDLKYILNFNKIKQLGWHPRVKFTDGLRQTVSWYRKNQDWWRQLQ
jgi:dTDP-glucose 4,6-dehydratase